MNDVPMVAVPTAWIRRLAGNPDYREAFVNACFDLMAAASDVIVAADRADFPLEKPSLSREDDFHIALTDAVKAVFPAAAVPTPAHSRSILAAAPADLDISELVDLCIVKASANAVTRGPEYISHIFGLVRFLETAGWAAFEAQAQALQRKRDQGLGSAAEQQEALRIADARLASRPAVLPPPPLALDTSVSGPSERMRQRLAALSGSGT